MKAIWRSGLADVLTCSAEAAGLCACTHGVRECCGVVDKVHIWKISSGQS